MTLYLVVGFLTFYLMVDSSSQLKLSIFFEKICIFIRIFGGWFLHYLLALLVFVHVSRFIFPWYLYLCNQGNLIFNDLKFFGKIDGTGNANEMLSSLNTLLSIISIQNSFWIYCCICRYIKGLVTSFIFFFVLSGRY